MPRFGFKEIEARDVATYLLRSIVLGGGSPTLRVAVYHGNWDKLPDLGAMEPVERLETDEVTVAVTDRRDQFALRLESYLRVEKAGRFTFHLGSDDGSRLWVDGEVWIDNDNVQPYTVKSKGKKLERGVHLVRVDYFEMAGEEKLTVEVEGPGVGRVSLADIGMLDKDAPPPEPLVTSVKQPREDLVAKGSQAFQQLGCASCHVLPANQGKGKDAIASTGRAKPLGEVRIDAGCLAAKPPATVPQYDLAPNQRQQIAAAIERLRSGATLSDGQRVHQQMLAMNCYACHVRDGVGGPESARDDRFKTKVPEMGEEGRLPPVLTGAGDKLNESYLAQVIDRGADERPYMLTMMPGFGASHVPGLVEAMVKIDRQEPPVTIPQPDEAETRVISNGRLLVGEQGLSCVKCHTFKGVGTPGIQAIDLLSIPKRVREDWFHRYLVAPQRYRPGTRMPTSFNGGKSVLADPYHGDPDLQIHAMWKYLQEGNEAREPAGLSPNRIVLKPVDRPVIYRNFIEGLTPRGIAVGYPEAIHQAWDAGRMGLKFVWRGSFIDAAKHWQGRGQGFQSPDGDELIEIENAVPLAYLKSPDQTWPSESARELGYQFKGYQLDSKGRPTFMYQLPEQGTVTERLEPFADQPDRPQFRRVLQIGANRGMLFGRLAAGKKIESVGKGIYSIDGQWQIRVPDSIPARVVQFDGSMELRAEVPAAGGTWSWDIVW